MSSNRKLFAKSVNELLAKLIKPELDEAEAELIEKGKTPEEIEEILSNVKMKSQVQMLPIIRKFLLEQLKEENRKEQTAESKTTVANEPSSSSSPSHAQHAADQSVQKENSKRHKVK